MALTVCAHIRSTETSLRLPLLGKFSSLPIGRGCIAQLYQPETVTPENIAYTVTLVMLFSSDLAHTHTPAV